MKNIIILTLVLILFNTTYSQDSISLEGLHTRDTSLKIKCYHPNKKKLKDFDSLEMIKYSKNVEYIFGRLLTKYRKSKNVETHFEEYESSELYTFTSIGTEGVHKLFNNKDYRRRYLDELDNHRFMMRVSLDDSVLNIISPINDTVISNKESYYRIEHEDRYVKLNDTDYKVISGVVMEESDSVVDIWNYNSVQMGTMIFKQWKNDVEKEPMLTKPYLDCCMFRFFINPDKTWTTFVSMFGRVPVKE